MWNCFTGQIANLLLRVQIFPVFVFGLQKAILPNIDRSEPRWDTISGLPSPETKPSLARIILHYSWIKMNSLCPKFKLLASEPAGSIHKASLEPQVLMPSMGHTYAKLSSHSSFPGSLCMMKKIKTIICQKISQTFTTNVEQNAPKHDKAADFFPVFQMLISIETILTMT